MYKRDEITIIDNFLSSEKFKKLSNEFFDENRRWRIVPSIHVYDAGKEHCMNPKYDVQGVDLLFHYLEPEISEEKLYPLAPIFSKLKVSKKQITKVKANCNFCRSENYVSGFHVDVEKRYLENGMTAIFYLNTNDGKTLFETGEEIESIENRIVIFPNQMRHAPMWQTDCARRVILNINWDLTES